eukprot:scaffold44833_cov66-Phaeocystis_antarctica.AAC.2
MVPMFRCGFVLWNVWLMQRLPSAGLSPLTLLIVAGSMEQEVVAPGLRPRENCEGNNCGRTARVMILSITAATLARRHSSSSSSSPWSSSPWVSCVTSHDARSYGSLV